MFSYTNLFAVSAVAGFRSDVVVKSHTPISNSTNMISAGLRRDAGACFFTNPAQKRDSTEYFVLNGVRTNDTKKILRSKAKFAHKLIFFFARQLYTLY